MSLTRITEKNVDAFIAFVIEYGEDEAREFLERTDARPMILKRGEDYFFARDGQDNEATASIIRTPHRDGVTFEISLYIITKTESDACFDRTLRTFLDFEMREPIFVPRRYLLVETPEKPLPPEPLAALGFKKVAGRGKCRRDAGPAEPGTFPLADKALARGYVTERVTAASLAAYPDLAEQMAEIFSQAFATRTSAGTRDAEDMRRRLDDEHNHIVGIRLGGTLVGFSTWTAFGEEILGSDIAVRRSHWGSGAADALCRHIINDVHAQTGKPIVTYVDVTNTASSHMLERVGFRLVEDYPFWERMIAADESPL